MMVLLTWSLCWMVLIIMSTNNNNHFMLTSAETTTSTSSSSNSECYLKCPNGIECVIGEVTEHPATLFNDMTSSTTWTGMHCACPEGYTGLMCEVPYESCSRSSSTTSSTTSMEESDLISQHKCYNNGQCVPGQLDYFGNDQFFCDCTGAVDLEQGLSYVGKYCEHAVRLATTPNASGGAPAATTTTTTTTAAASNNINAETVSITTTSSCQADPEGFCLNGGKCNNQYPSLGPPCLCASGFSGLRCEYVDGTVPDCTLSCNNGGVCVLGPIQERVFEPLWKDVVIDSDKDGTNDLDYMHCECPDNFDGPLCATERTACGEDSVTGIANYCYHGSKCVHDSTNSQSVPKCDCSTANTLSASYAGTFCQYEAEVYCKKNEDADENLFCTNGGSCRAADQVSDGCICPKGFEGFSCQYVTGELEDVDSNPAPSPSSSSSETTTNEDTDTTTSGEDDVSGSTGTSDSAECDIQCRNGGVCRMGAKKVSYQLQQIVQDTQHLFFDADDTNFYHCVCTDEWTGALCDVPVDSCTGDDKHVCLHGGKCVATGDEQLCDCDQADSEMASFFAGQHCEHPINDICTTDDVNPIHGLPLSFCVNGGICKSRVDGGQPHPGCYCEQGFIGPHCELRESVHIQSTELPQTWTSDNAINRTRDYNEGRKGDKSPGQTAGIVIGILIALLVPAYLSIMYVRRRKRKLAGLNSTIMWAEKFHDNPTDDGAQNIAPRRNFTFSDYNTPANSGNKSIDTKSYASSRDPMATHLAPATLLASKKDTKSPAYVSDSEDDENEEDDHYQQEFQKRERDGVLKTKSEVEADQTPQVYIGPPRDEDGHVLHNVDIV